MNRHQVQEAAIHAAHQAQEAAMHTGYESLDLGRRAMYNVVGLFIDHPAKVTAAASALIGVYLGTR